MVYTKHSGDFMNKYVIKRIIKYTFLFLILVICTQYVYKVGKKSYQEYINSHENDLEWVEKNISFAEDYKIGGQVQVVNMPSDLTVSTKNYTDIIERKIKTLLIQQYSINNPLLLYNPYREDENCLYIYFHTGEKYRAQYFVSTESIVMQDMETLLYQDFLDSNGNPYETVRHYYKLDSLTPGKKNHIILRIVDESGNVVEAENFILNIPNERK